MSSYVVPNTKREIQWLALGTLTGVLIGSLMYSSRAKKKTKSFNEFSAVYTDRSLNMMSDEFVKVMQDINATLKEVYNAKHTAIIPGSGSYAMEAVARQFARDKKVVIVRNGYFSFRWTDIFTRCCLPKEEIVLIASPVDESSQPQYAPYEIEDLLKTIQAERPDAVFAPHVETSTGMILPDQYIKRVAEAVHDVGGVFVLDCVSSGTIWVDMEELGIDALISAPQKGWTGPCCVGIVALSERGYKRMWESESDSLVTNLKMWCSVMNEYAEGGFKYWTTLPTDALKVFRDVMLETKAFGFAKAKTEQWRLGETAREKLFDLGFKGVSCIEYQAPGVVVAYIPEELKGFNFFREFRDEGVQIATGVGWKLNEPLDRGKFETVRIGLFGLDKIMNVNSAIASLTIVMERILSKTKGQLNLEE